MLIPLNKTEINDKCKELSAKILQLVETPEYPIKKELIELHSFIKRILYISESKYSVKNEILFSYDELTDLEYIEIFITNLCDKRPNK